MWRLIYSPKRKVCNYPTHWKWTCSHWKLWLSAYRSWIQIVTDKVVLSLKTLICSIFPPISDRFNIASCKLFFIQKIKWGTLLFTQVFVRKIIYIYWGLSLPFNPPVFPVCYLILHLDSASMLCFLILETICRKIRLIERNAKCCHGKKLTCKGTLRQVFICLRSPPLLGFCLGWKDNFVGSESGQIHSVKLLQNMVSNTTQQPLTPSHQ